MRSLSSQRWPRAALMVASLAACLVLALAGCGAGSTVHTATATQQPLLAKDVTGTPIVIPAKAPQRIVSLTPGDSEMLGALNLDARVVGVDAFTTYPADLASKPKVTNSSGTVNIEQILALSPDLVLSWGGFYTQADHQLQQAHIEVVDLPQENLSGTLLEMRLIGQLTHTENVANAVVAKLQQRITAVEQKVANAPRVTVYMEVGYTPPPPYAYGGGSFGDEIIRDAGGTDIFASDTSNAGYPQVSVENIIAANPQVIILTEDPQYGGNPAAVVRRPGWSAIVAVQDHRVYQISADLIQEPGPRLVDALEQVAKDLHPNLYT